MFRITYDSETNQNVITDHAGNRVFGIKDKKIIKEHRLKEEANIVSKDSFSPTASGNAGITELGEVTEMKAEQVGGTPLAATEFISRIRNILKGKGKPSGSLKSVDVMDLSNVSEPQKVATPRGVEKGSVGPDFEGITLPKRDESVLETTPGER